MKMLADLLRAATGRPYESDDCADAPRAVVEQAERDRRVRELREQAEDAEVRALELQVAARTGRPYRRRRAR